MQRALDEAQYGEVGHVLAQQGQREAAKEDLRVADLRAGSGDHLGYMRSIIYKEEKPD